MVRLFGVAIQTFHHECRMYAIKVADGEMSVEHSIVETHVVGAAVASVGITSIPYFAVFKLVAVDFLSCFSIDDGHVERWQFRCLAAVVHNTVVIGVGLCTAVGIFAPAVIGFVPKSGAVGAFDDDLAFPIAVDVVSDNHIVLPSANVDVWSHVHRPEEGPVETVGLDFVAGGEIY